jgi:diaminohydroxyphosphoribosylaminopyrimidine deaminase / 5-amino-6-(5-phosphoribosylamino)uracil reductase
MDRPADASAASRAQHAAWMRRALDLAARGRPTVSPNPMVGCVLVRDGSIVGEGWHERAGGPHAEVVALEAAGEAAAGAVAYVTLEPCTHTGRTGPCTKALLAAGVSQVVIAAEDPSPVAGGGAEVLRAADVLVVTGVLAEEARAQNAVFFHRLESGRPFVIAKVAVSLDGRIAAGDGTSQWLTGPAARQRAHALRAEVDAVAVGSGTVLADDPVLTCRLPGYSGSQPLRVVLDSRHRTPSDARVLDASAPTVLFVAADPGDGGAAGVIGELRAVERCAIPEAADGSGVDLERLLDALADRAIGSLLVEGGSAVLGSFLRADLVDRLVVHVAPVLLGERGRPLLVGPWASSLADAPRFDTLGVEQVGPDVIITLSPDREER